MIQITCITKDGGNHENPHVAISHLGWVDVYSGERGNSSRLVMYNFILKGGEAYVLDRFGNKAFLIAEKSVYGTPYVKTRPDSTKTDNLLSLQECKG